MHLLDTTGYASLKQILQSTLAIHSNNAVVCANVPALVRPQEPEWAEQLLERVVHLDATNLNLLRRLEELRKAMPALIANRDSFLHSSEPFVYAEKCSHS